MTDEDIIVTMRDARKVGFCADVLGYAIKYGIDWRRFARDGIPAGELMEIATAADDRVDDVKRLINAAKERVKNGRQ